MSTLTGLFKDGIKSSLKNFMVLSDYYYLIIIIIIIIICLHTIICFQVMFKYILARSAGVVEYTDCISVEV